MDYMIMKDKKSYNMNNEGSAIITGLVVSAILMVLCLSLLLVSYSLFMSTAENTSSLSDRELLYSAAESLEHELTDESIDIKDLNNDGSVSDTLTEEQSSVLERRSLWRYIYGNIWKGFGDGEEAVKDINGHFVQDANSWLYYDTMVSYGNHSDLEKCSKYFLMTSIGGVKLIVQFYWQLPTAWDGKIDDKNGTMLFAIYKLYNKKGELLLKVDRKYKLSVSDNNISGDTGESTGSITGEGTGSMTGEGTGSITGESTGSVTGEGTGSVTGESTGVGKNYCWKWNRIGSELLIAGGGEADAG